MAFRPWIINGGEVTGFVYTAFLALNPPCPSLLMRILSLHSDTRRVPSSWEIYLLLSGKKRDLSASALSLNSFILIYAVCQGYIWG